MKKVLVIAYYFPPTGGGGVQRAAKFVKYLPSFGWRPVVLTVKNPDFDVFDESLVKDIPSDVKVYRTYSFNPVRWYRIRRHGANSLFGRRDKGSSGNGRRSSVLQPFRKAVKYIFNNFIFIPDDYVGWIPFAVVKGYFVIRKEKIDAVYATGKPWSVFVIAFFLRLLTGRPYVLDLRDPWVLTPYGGSKTNSLKRKIERLWESTCFSNAEKVININEQISRTYVQYYSSLPSEKFGHITHGYDAEDFAAAGRNKKKDDKFTISYIGTFYTYESPELFLRAAKDLLKNNKELRERLRINFIGLVPPYVMTWIEESGFRDSVTVFGYLPHGESIQHMIDSDVLLLLLNKVETNTAAQVSTGKLFEYLASRRPILALIPDDTDAALLINELGAGRVIDPDDIEGIKESVNIFYEEYKKNELKSHTADLSGFSRKELAGKLSAILDQV